MIYLDTSFIAPRYIAEATSEKVEQFLLQLDSSEEIAISSWTHVEFASLLSRRLRMQEIHETMAIQMMAMFEYDLRESFHVFIPTVADYDLAVHLLQKQNHQPDCEQGTLYIWRLRAIINVNFIR